MADFSSVLRNTNVCSNLSSDVFCLSAQCSAGCPFRPFSLSVLFMDVEMDVNPIRLATSKLSYHRTQGQTYQAILPASFYELRACETIPTRPNQRLLCFRVDVPFLSKKFCIFTV